MKHVSALDGLRAIAVLIVIVSHAGLGHIVPGGFGVTIFFFLSGFLITTLMRLEWLKTGKVGFKGFYFRRIVRIIPPMVIAIAFTVAITEIGLQPRPIANDKLIWDFLFLTNYADLFDSSSGIPIPLWSLDIEEHFYILFPLIFFAVAARKGPRGVAITCAILCAAVLAIRVATYLNAEQVWNIYYWSHTRIDSILYGCILATWNNPVIDKKVRIGGHISIGLFAIALIFTTLLIRDPMFRETIRYSIQGIGLLLIFNFILRDSGIISRMLSTRPLKIVADYSYTLYLIHVPLLLTTGNLLDEHPIWVQYAAGFAASFTFAALVHIWVERPLAAWRKRTETKPASVKAPSPKEFK